MEFSLSLGYYGLMLYARGRVIVYCAATNLLWIVPYLGSYNQPWFNSVGNKRKDMHVRKGICREEEA